MGVSESSEMNTSGEMDDQSNIDQLKNMPSEGLNEMLHNVRRKGGSATERSEKEWPILQAMFEQRGATRKEAIQQIDLNKRYQLNTTVDPSGNLGMWPASASKEKVTKILEENPNLEERIKYYLNQYFEKVK